MLDQISSYWQFGTTFCSIEVTSLSNNENTLFAVSAKKKKGEFTGLQFEKSNDFSALEDKLPSNQHCFLTIATDKVLIKKVTYQENQANVLSDAFPGLSHSDFYYEIITASENCFVLVCRKNYVDSLVKEAESAKLHILGFHLGFSQIPTLLSFLAKNHQLSTFRYRLELFQNTIAGYRLNKSIEQEEKEYKIEDITVPSNYLIAISGLFQYINKNTANSNLKEKNADLKKQFDQRVFFKKGSRVGIGLLLLILLANFFVFNSYFQEKQQLQESVLLTKSQKDLYEKRLESIETKEKMVKNILLSGNSKSTFYLNRVVSSKPNTIQLQELTFQPLQKSVRPLKEIAYDFNTIEVAGESSNKSNFSNWIEALEKNEWVTSITVLEYGNTTKGINSFKFLISIGNEAEK